MLAKNLSFLGKYSTEKLPGKTGSFKGKNFRIKLALGKMITKQNELQSTVI